MFTFASFPDKSTDAFALKLIIQVDACAPVQTWIAEAFVPILAGRLHWLWRCVSDNDSEAVVVDRVWASRHVVLPGKTKLCRLGRGRGGVSWRLGRNACAVEVASFLRIRRVWMFRTMQDTRQIRSCLQLINYKQSQQTKSELMSWKKTFSQNLILISSSWEMLFCNWRVGLKNPVGCMDVLIVGLEIQSNVSHIRATLQPILSVCQSVCPSIGWLLRLSVKLCFVYFFRVFGQLLHYCSCQMHG